MISTDLQNKYEFPECRSVGRSITAATVVPFPAPHRRPAAHD